MPSLCSQRLGGIGRQHTVAELVHTQTHHVRCHLAIFDHSWTKTHQMPLLLRKGAGTAERNSIPSKKFFGMQSYDFGNKTLLRQTQKQARPRRFFHDGWCSVIHGRIIFWTDGIILGKLPADDLLPPKRPMAAGRYRNPYSAAIYGQSTVNPGPSLPSTEKYSQDAYFKEIREFPLFFQSKVPLENFMLGDLEKIIQFTCGSISVDKSKRLHVFYK